MLLAFAMLFCACNRNDDDYIRLSSQETKQYCESIAGSYEAKGYEVLVAYKDFYNSEVIGRQVDIDDVSINIFDAPECDMIFWHVPVNLLASLLPEDSEARKVLEECEPISFTTSYGFENAVTSVQGQNMVNFTFKPVTYYCGTSNHQIAIEISPTGIYLPYTSDKKAIREAFLKSQIRFDVLKMKVDGVEYKHFDLVVATDINEETEQEE